MKRTALGLLVTVTVLGGVMMSMFQGCKPSTDSGDGENSASGNVLWRSELFDYAIDTLLNRMEEFYYSPERQQQTINRLDQWVRKQKPLEDWEPDPVIAGVAEELRGAAEQISDLAGQIDALRQGDNAVSVDNLPGEFRSLGKRLEQIGTRLALIDLLQLASEMAGAATQLEGIIGKNTAAPAQAVEAVRTAFSQFNVERFLRHGEECRLLSERIDPSILEFPELDGSVFQQSVWLRNVAMWASGDELDDPVKPATALFDWVVKNVDLIRDPLIQDADSQVRVLQTPLETLLLGKGTAIDRAWLFILLARQVNMDAALLGLVDENNVFTRLWGVGVLIEGEVYLFEPVLGVPIPKPGSMELTESGLFFAPATLAEAATDEAVFEQMQLISEGDYAVESKDMRRVVAFVEASPSYLSQRMKMVENRLAGDQKIVLTVDASAQIARFKECQYVVDGYMWPRPYQVFWQEIRLGPERRQWLNARLRPILFPPTMPFLWKARSYHFKGQFTGNPSATMFYQAARQSEYSTDSAAIGAQDKQLWREIKLDASYWLGLMTAHTGNYRAARDYLETRVLEADPGGKWEHGAAYNLARVAEATGKFPAAIQLYEIPNGAPQIQGNFIRAKWLRELTGQPVPELRPRAESKEAEEKAPENADTPETTPEAKSDDMQPDEEGKETKAEKDTPQAAPEKPGETPAPKVEESPEQSKEQAAPVESEEKSETEAKANPDPAK